MREADVFAIGAQQHSAAVHSRAWEIADDIAFYIDTQSDYYTSGLVFAQERACRAAYYYDGDLFAVSFHVDTCAVPGVTFYINSSSAHGVSDSVADVAVNDYFPCVHGVAYGVLRVTFHRYFAAVEIGAQGVTGSPRNIYFFIAHTRADKTLSQAVDDFYFVTFP